MSSKAVVYIAYGRQYIKEVKRSLASVNGQYPCIVCTLRGKEIDGAIPFKIPRRKTKHWFLDRCFYFIYVFWSTLDCDRLLFLDTDTFVCGDISAYFDALDRYDIVSTQAISQQTKQLDDVPPWFPEIHCGAFAIRRNRNVHELLNRWFDIYKKRPAFYGNDQPPMRQALWEMPEIRVGLLPVEYCFRYRWGGLLSRQVAMLHGKEHGTPYEEVVRLVNAQSGLRVFYRRQLA